MTSNLRLIGAILKERLSSELAFVGNTWAEIVSSVVYVASFLVFIELLFTRAGSIAGYSKDEFLFMFLASQVTFYVWNNLLFRPMAVLIESVRTGRLDSLLLRPVSALVTLYSSAQRPLESLLAAAPNIILVSILIDWTHLSISFSGIVVGAIVWLCGLVIYNTIMFIFAIPVFTQGDATNILQMSYTLHNSAQAPFQALPPFMKVLSFIALPSLLMSAGVAQIILGKHPDSSLPILLAALAVAVVAYLIFLRLWRAALQSYTSASS